MEKTKKSKPKVLKSVKRIKPVVVDNRTRILEAAAEIFIEKGYQATSLENIAERVGLHKATVYHYVKTKDEILYECLKFSFVEYDEIMRMMEDKSMPPLRRLRLFFVHLTNILTTNFGKCNPMISTQPLKGEMGGHIRTFQRQLDQIVRRVLSEGIEDGSIRNYRSGTLNAMLFGVFNWFPRWYSKDGIFTPEEIAQKTMDIIEIGVATDAMNWQKLLETKEVNFPKALQLEENNIAEPSQLDRIIITAARLFAANDFDATSLNDIAKELGINKATLYYYIKSKDELLYLCLERSFSNLDNVIEFLRRQDVPATLRMHTFHKLLFQAQNTDYGRCLNLISPQVLKRPLAEEIIKFQRRLDEAVKSLFAEGVSNGEFRPANPIIFTAILYGASNWVPRWFQTGREGGIEHVADTFFAVMMQGLVSRK